MTPDIEPPVQLESNENFVLVGPGTREGQWRGEKVLVQSKAAPVELLGAVRSAEIGARWRRSGSIASLLVQDATDQIMLIRSPLIGRRDPTSERGATYVLAWQGRISPAWLDGLEKTLRRNLPDVLDAIESGDAGGVAWAFSEIASELAAARAREKRRIRQFRLILIIYALTLLVAIVILISWLQL